MVAVQVEVEGRGGRGTANLLFFWGANQRGVEVGGEIKVYVKVGVYFYMWPAFLLRSML